MHFSQYFLLNNSYLINTLCVLEPNSEQKWTEMSVTKMRRVISKVFSELYIETWRMVRQKTCNLQQQIYYSKEKTILWNYMKMQMVISHFCKCAHCSHYIYLEPYSLIMPVPIKLSADKSLMSHLAHCQNDWSLSLRKRPEPMDDVDGHTERSLTHFGFTRLEWVGLINLGLQISGLWCWVLWMFISTHGKYIRCKICSHTERGSHFIKCV